MKIKTIAISNFRSFKNQQPTASVQNEDDDDDDDNNNSKSLIFDSRTNCVVGRNGSGKSNLFDAVQFVLLAPKFQTLRQVRAFWLLLCMLLSQL